jgi:hypothetical protein
LFNLKIGTKNKTIERGKYYMNEDEMLKKFNAEHDEVYTSPPLPNPADLQNQGTAGQAPNVTTQQQAVISEMTSNAASQPAPATPPNPNPMTTQPTTTSAQEAVGGLCSECGTMHPPVRAGEKCPNAKVNLPSITNDEIGYFLSNIKNIIISQSEKNKIKDVKKLFQQSIVVLAKFLEEYKEEENDTTKNPTQEAGNKPV